MAMRWISPIIEGEIYENSNGSKVEVTFVESARKVHFKCLDNYGYNGVCTAEHLKSGVFSNPYDKTLCGVGYLGVGIHKTRTNGTKNEASFWINFKERLIYIRYFAVRDADKKYKGVIEISQDITDIKKIEGEQRLLDWE